MNILIIGFGGIGCRHAQSFLKNLDEYHLYVVEPNHDNITSNSERIGVKGNEIIFYTDLMEVKENIDCAIIATSAFPRLNLLWKVAEMGIKHVLLEKVVFQSQDQFEEAMSIVKQNGIRAYCNFVMRYYPAYKEFYKLLNDYERNPIEMFVTGGEFGLACNALHYADLFQFLVKCSSYEQYSLMQENPKQNKRGSIYKELTGSFALISDLGDQFSVISEPDSQSDVVVTIKINNQHFYFNEGKKTKITFDNSAKDIKIDVFAMPGSSMLSLEIVRDILSGQSILPTISETYLMHSLFFESAAKAFGASFSKTYVCPIT